MILFRHELKQGRKALLLWTAAIAGFIAMCVFLYPEMKDQMGNVSEMFSSMGFFSAAFGMDKLNFGSLTGFYAVECGTILSLGGAFFAALTAVNRLSKEEKEHTAEFLLAHPLNRGEILRGKLAAMFTELTAMHILVSAVSILSIWCIGEKIPWRELSMLHLAYWFCQVEIVLICFAVSAFCRGNNNGIGIALAMVFYFMSLLANVSDRMKAFHMLSPFGYAEGADILTKGGLEWKLIVSGIAAGIICAVIGALHYQRKDIYMV